MICHGQNLRLWQAHTVQLQSNRRRRKVCAVQAISPAATAPGFQHTPEQCKAENIRWQEGSVPRATKEAILRQHGCVLWFTGLSGAGKSTVAAALEHELAQRGCLTALLDGDNVRHGLCCNLGFSADDREENIRRIGEVARLFAECGVICITAFISPYREDRQRVRVRLAPRDFVEIHMKVPLQICEQRDCKGLYKLARAGKIRGFTGVDDPYEEPLSPELALEPLAPDGTPNTPEQMAAEVIAFLERSGYLTPAIVCGHGNDNNHGNSL